MKQHALLSALGRDRVGVADDLATALADRRIDIEHSRMTALSGRFALLVQLCGEEESITGLRHDLADLGSNLGFHLQLRPVRPTGRSTREAQFLLESFSAGPSGLSAVTALLKRHDINIEDLETEASAAPWKSEITFYMKARITLPPSCSISTLRQALRELEGERNVDVVIKPAPLPTAEALTTT